MSHPSRRSRLRTFAVPSAAAAAVLAAGLGLGAALDSGPAGATAAPASGSAPKVPEKPRAVSGTNANTVTWTASSGARKYDVYRAEGDGAFTRVGSVTAPKYTDGRVVPDVPYTYKVKAVGSAGKASPYSAAARAARDTIAPLPPANLAVVPSDDGPGTALAWRDGTDAVAYTVYRSTSPQGPLKKIGTSTTTSFRDTGAPAPDRPYVYWVKAVDAAGNASEAATTSRPPEPTRPPTQSPGPTQPPTSPPTTPAPSPTFGDG
ncbi:fibronectin type III domain-containing protein [Streptomyces spectabilis]|uniref:Fibronectin type 3 domain-containing protein n=1 Tax=Streptomyces spectabilis TaxID=68270 RepID=A0A7W8ASC2_STRST|nr:hypothetical protein [Streptomyces spectabilis]MBB5103734.1 fibronectin type 3 domain-containing protein [Streptomyces spectabilis]MCI3904024.1 hypothetical protein [Streptomyces spectabilis]